MHKGLQKLQAYIVVMRKDFREPLATLEKPIMPVFKLNLPCYLCNVRVNLSHCQ